MPRNEEGREPRGWAKTQASMAEGGIGSGSAPKQRKHTPQKKVGGQLDKASYRALSRAEQKVHERAGTAPGQTGPGQWGKEEATPERAAPGIQAAMPTGTPEQNIDQVRTDVQQDPQVAALMAAASAPDMMGQLSGPQAPGMDPRFAAMPTGGGYTGGIAPGMVPPAPQPGGMMSNQMGAAMAPQVPQLMQGGGIGAFSNPAGAGMTPTSGMGPAPPQMAQQQMMPQQQLYGG